VWLDAPVIQFIKAHQIATGTPRHERDRILRRAKVYALNKGELQRRMPEGTLCVVPKPEEKVKPIQCRAWRAQAAKAFWSLVPSVYVCLSLSVCRLSESGGSE